jgi:hypothetical protein
MKSTLLQRVSKFPTVSLLEKKRDQTQNVLSEKELDNIQTCLKVCLHKCLLRQESFVTGYMK